MSGPVIRVRIDEADFRQLVAGKVARLVSAKGEVIEVILADIGFDRMEIALTTAVLARTQGMPMIKDEENDD